MKAELTSVKRERDALTAERDELSAQRAELAEQLEAGVAPAEDPALRRRIQQAETEVIGLRAELDGSQTQLTMAAARARDPASAGGARQGAPGGPGRGARGVAPQPRGVRVGAVGGARRADRARGRAGRTPRAPQRGAARGHARGRAAGRRRRSSRASRASHRAELVEREAEFEEKVRGAREEFQAQVASLEAAQAAAIAARGCRPAPSAPPRSRPRREADLEALQQELADRDARYGTAEQAVEAAKARGDASGRRARGRRSSSWRRPSSS